MLRTLLSFQIHLDLVGVLGFEPRTSSLSGTRSNQLSYTPSRFISSRHREVVWWSWWGSNPRHPACKAGALANWATAPFWVHPESQLQKFFVQPSDLPIRFGFENWIVRCNSLVMSPSPTSDCSEFNHIGISSDCSLERRWSSRWFPNGYLVTTSSQSSTEP